MCTKNHIPILSKIIEDKSIFDDFGKIVNECILEIPVHFPNTMLDEYIIMPNHIHLIIHILPNGNIQGAETAPLRQNLGKIIAYFKYISTKRTNELRNTPGLKFWQRNYYEHIIRNDDDLYNIRKYITENPLKWKSDKYYRD
ncbi:transposase [candidate division KSB1 bacterium]